MADMSRSRAQVGGAKRGALVRHPACVQSRLVRHHHEIKPDLDRNVHIEDVRGILVVVAVEPEVCELVE